MNLDRCLYHVPIFYLFGTALKITPLMSLILLWSVMGDAAPSSPPPSSLPPSASAKGEAALRSGPMVGFGGHHEVTLWLQTKIPSEVIVRYWPKEHLDQAQQTPSIRTAGENNRTYKHTISPLQPNTKYVYEVIINGEVAQRPYPLQFQTQVRWKRRRAAPDFMAAIGSCSYLNQGADETYGGETEIFESIRKTQPHFMLWLGDAVYLTAEDWSSRTGIFRRYSSYRAHPALQALLASVHHYATWDDHDYGPNDGNRSYPLKSASLDAFKEYWTNPSYGLPHHPGVFGSFSWSDVDFFLLDNRTYRAASEGPINPQKDYLGEVQLNWLFDALLNSRATFKIVASGSQVLSPFHRFESYAQHPHELKRLLQGLKDRAIEGVVFLSGDRHHTELNRLQDDPQFYPLYDFTSSPLTSRPASSSNDELHSPRRVSGTFVKGRRSFGVLKFSGPPDDRRVIMEARGVKGETLWSYEIKANDLKIPKKK